MLKSYRSEEDIETIAYYLSNTNLYKKFSAFTDNISITKMKYFCSMIIKYKHLRPRECVFKYQDIGDNFYILLKGKLGVFIPKDVQYKFTYKEIAEVLRYLKYKDERILLGKIIESNREVLFDFICEYKRVENELIYSKDKKMSLNYDLKDGYYGSKSVHSNISNINIQFNIFDSYNERNLEDNKDENNDINKEEISRKDKYNIQENKLNEENRIDRKEGTLNSIGMIDKKGDNAYIENINISELSDNDKNDKGDKGDFSIKLVSLISNKKKLKTRSSNCLVEDKTNIKDSKKELATISSPELNMKTNISDISPIKSNKKNIWKVIKNQNLKNTKKAIDADSFKTNNFFVKDIISNSIAKEEKNDRRNITRKRRKLYYDDNIDDFSNCLFKKRRKVISQPYIGRNYNIKIEENNLGIGIDSTNNINNDNGNDNNVNVNSNKNVEVSIISRFININSSANDNLVLLSNKTINNNNNINNRNNIYNSNFLLNSKLPLTNNNPLSINSLKKPHDSLNNNDLLDYNYLVNKKSRSKKLNNNNTSISADIITNYNKKINSTNVIEIPELKISSILSPKKLDSKTHKKEIKHTTVSITTTRSLSSSIQNNNLINKNNSKNTNNKDNEENNNSDRSIKKNKTSNLVIDDNSKNNLNSINTNPNINLMTSDSQNAIIITNNENNNIEQNIKNIDNDENIGSINIDRNSISYKENLPEKLLKIKVNLEQILSLKYNKEIINNLSSKKRIFINYEYKLINELKTGDYFGEVSLESSGKRAATIAALEENAHLGYINDYFYKQIIQNEKQRLYISEINFLHNSFCFKKIKKTKFETMFYFFNSLTLDKDCCLVKERIVNKDIDYRLLNENNNVRERHIKQVLNEKFGINELNDKNTNTNNGYYDSNRGEAAIGEISLSSPRKKNILTNILRKKNKEKMRDEDKHHLVEDFYFIRKGTLELSTNKSIFEMNELIEKLYKEFDNVSISIAQNNNEKSLNEPVNMNDNSNIENNYNSFGKEREIDNNNTQENASNLKHISSIKNIISSKSKSISKLNSYDDGKQEIYDKSLISQNISNLSDENRSNTNNGIKGSVKYITNTIKNHLMTNKQYHEYTKNTENLDKLKNKLKIYLNNNNKNSDMLIHINKKLLTIVDAFPFNFLEYILQLETPLFTATVKEKPITYYKLSIKDFKSSISPYLFFKKQDLKNFISMNVYNILNRLIWFYNREFDLIEKIVISGNVDNDCSVFGYSSLIKKTVKARSVFYNNNNKNKKKISDVIDENHHEDIVCGDSSNEEEEYAEKIEKQNKQHRPFMNVIKSYSTKSIIDYVDIKKHNIDNNIDLKKNIYYDAVNKLISNTNSTVLPDIKEINKMNNKEKNKNYNNIDFRRNASIFLSSFYSVRSDNKDKIYIEKENSSSDDSSVMIKNKKQAQIDKLKIDYKKNDANSNIKLKDSHNNNDNVETILFLGNSSKRDSIISNNIINSNINSNSNRNKKNLFRKPFNLDVKSQQQNLKINNTNYRIDVDFIEEATFRNALNNKSQKRVVLFDKKLIDREFNKKNEESINRFKAAQNLLLQNHEKQIIKKKLSQKKSYTSNLANPKYKKLDSLNTKSSISPRKRNINSNDNSSNGNFKFIKDFHTIDTELMYNDTIQSDFYNTIKSKNNSNVKHKDCYDNNTKCSPCLNKRKKFNFISKIKSKKNKNNDLNLINGLNYNNKNFFASFTSKNILNVEEYKPDPISKYLLHSKLHNKIKEQKQEDSNNSRIIDNTQIEAKYNKEKELLNIRLNNMKIKDNNKLNSLIKNNSQIGRLDYINDNNNGNNTNTKKLCDTYYNQIRSSSVLNYRTNQKNRNSILDSILEKERKFNIEKKISLNKIIESNTEKFKKLDPIIIAQKRNISLPKAFKFYNPSDTNKKVDYDFLMYANFNNDDDSNFMYKKIIDSMIKTKNSISEVRSRLYNKDLLV